MNAELAALVQAAAAAGVRRETVAVALTEAHKVMEARQAEYDAAADAEATAMAELIAAVKA